MRQFPLKVSSETLNFDTDGRVLDTASNVVGTWTTTADNKIQFRQSGGGATDIDVGWAFNAANQLTIIQANKIVFTILNTTEGLPRFSLVKNRLVIDPDGDNNFSFALQCLFGMNTDGNLIVSINGKESVIDGFIEDSKSRFRFQFFDKDLPTLASSLVFAGQWERKTAGASDEIRLHFLLDEPKLEISSKPLDLPGKLRVDPARNHLALVYQSKTHGQHQLQFLGSLEIRPNLTLSFRIDDVKENGLRKSRIEVETTFEWDVAKGTLAFFVGKTRTPSSQVVEVGGALNAQLKNGELKWNFAYRNTTAGGKSETTIATHLEFKVEGNSIVVQYEQAGKTRKLDVTAKIEKENFTITGGVQIANDPQGRRLKAFVGVSW